LHRFDVVARLRGLARRRGFRRQALGSLDRESKRKAPTLLPIAPLSSDLIAGNYTDRR
jgi:hypothetical protein